jgi:enoyl-CoA hydratase
LERATGLVKAEVVEGAAVVTLDDPDRRNALSRSMVAELVATFDWLERRSDVGAVVVTGAPPAFCAGADLSELGASREVGLREIYDGFLRVARCPLPTIAAVNGAAVGAGMNLALCCDVRIADHSARFDSRFLQLGIHPGGGHTWMLDRMLGPQGTAAMVLCGDVLSGRDAERLGLAWRAMPDGEGLAEAVRLARRAASVPRPLLEQATRTLDRVADVADHAAAVEWELDFQLESMEQPAFMERLAAARTRPPSS